MKIIDLLNKIANGEELPLKIKVKDYIFRQSNGQFWCDETEEYLIDNCTSIYHLNDEVEIIEENNKQIKKLYHCVKELEEENKDIEFCIKNLNYMVDKINEIIDKLNKGE